MARRDPTAVWLRRRKGKRGLTYGLRWIDPATGRGRSEACGSDLAYARQRRAQVREELRAGVDKYTVKDLGGWSVVSVVEKHYTGDVSAAHRRAMLRIAERAG